MLFDSIDTEKTTDEDLLKLGMRQSMVDYLRETEAYIMIQTKPSIIDGQERWAWYEINPYTYETMSVLDTGEHGAMTSEAVLQDMVGVAQYLVGAFKGVETSVWSVAAFSLELSDYDEILKRAKAFALGIAENFKVPDAKEMLTNAAKKAAMDAAKDMAKDMGMDPDSTMFKPPWNDPRPDKEDYKGFQNGFKEGGVNYYFENAK